MVYPHQGLGRIDGVEHIDFKGKKELYYVIFIKSIDMTIKVPAFNFEKLGIRKISSKAKTKKILEDLTSGNIKVESDWKARQNINLDLIKRSNMEDIAKVVKSLYHRSRTKEIPTMEKKIYDKAMSILIDEIAISLNQDRGSIEEKIKENLNQNYNNSSSKRFSDEDDDDDLDLDEDEDDDDLDLDDEDDDFLDEDEDDDDEDF